MNDEGAHTSYLSRCLKDMFLRMRKPIALFRNPVLSLMDDPKCSDQLVRAVCFLHAIVRLQNSILDHKLEPDLIWTCWKKGAYPSPAETLGKFK